MQSRSAGDQAILDRLRWAPNGASAIDIAKASLGDRARRHSNASLSQIGLSIAVRLIGEGLVEATRTNQFRIKREKAA
jgi:hypothetical protein